MELTRCIKHARDGDLTATRRLVEALRPRITRMAFHYARRCGEDPDDMVQEAWAAVLEALPEVDVAIGSPEQYLIRCARWRVLDSIKRARVRRCERFSEVECADSNIDSRADRPARRVLDGRFTARHLPDDERILSEVCVAEFRSMLREPQRAVLECLLAGLTWREAGSALGCTSANVAYYVRQIKRRYVEWSGQAP